MQGRRQGWEVGSVGVGSNRERMPDVDFVVLVEDRAWWEMWSPKGQFVRPGRRISVEQKTQQVPLGPLPRRERER